MPAVEVVVQEAVEHVTTWLHSRQVVPVIAGLRRKVEALANAEVEQALRRLDELDPHTQHVIVHLAHRIVNKLLHEPTVRLKAQAANGNGRAYAQAIQELFGPDIPEAIAGRTQTSHADGTTAPWPTNTSMRMPRLPQECER